MTSCGHRPVRRAQKRGLNTLRPNVKLQGARAADNVGRVPRQIPSTKAQSLQQLRRRDLADTI
jgi:hypothetical protein